MGFFSKKKEVSAEDEDLKTVTKEELSSHNTKTSLWIAIDGMVYDLTKWQSEHPGGDSLLLEKGGDDASESFDDVGHSKDAKKQLTKLLVGKLG